MKCICNQDLKVEEFSFFSSSFNKIINYFCLNYNCKYSHTNVISTKMISNEIFKMKINLFFVDNKINGKMYGFCFGSKHYDQDFEIDKDMAEFLLKQSSLEDIIKIYNNYCIFI